jgi:molybdopterin molybdotransferase
MPATEAERTEGAELTPVDEALTLLLSLLRPTGTEAAGLDAAHGRVLAEAVAATVLSPPHTASTFDGYAIRAADVPAAGTVLPVVAELHAGAAPGIRIEPGTAVAIATGAPLPEGADTVVQSEHTDGGADRVTFDRVTPVGTGLVRAGEDFSPGDPLLPAGRVLTAADLGVCAATGLAAVTVRRRPRVAVLSGGDELVAAGEVPVPGQRFDATQPALLALAREAGAEVTGHGIMPDDPSAVRAALAAAAAEADLVVSTAGVCIGPRDFVRPAVESMGEILLSGVALRPGKPVAIGRIGDVPFLGLPGNPVSVLVTFRLFVLPAILALQGATAEPLRRWQARALEPMSSPGHLETYYRGILEGDSDDPRVRLTGTQSSAAITSLSRGDCLVVIPRGRDRVEAGEMVEVVPL